MGYSVLRRSIVTRRRRQAISTHVCRAGSALLMLEKPRPPLSQTSSPPSENRISSNRFDDAPDSPRRPRAIAESLRWPVWELRKYRASLGRFLGKVTTITFSFVRHGSHCWASRPNSSSRFQGLAVDSHRAAGPDGIGILSLIPGRPEACGTRTTLLHTGAQQRSVPVFVVARHKSLPRCLQSRQKMYAQPTLSREALSQTSHFAYKQHRT